MALPALPESGTRKETGGGSGSGFEQSQPLLLLTVYRATGHLKARQLAKSNAEWHALEQVPHAAAASSTSSQRCRALVGSSLREWPSVS